MICGNERSLTRQEPRGLPRTKPKSSFSRNCRQGSRIARSDRRRLHALVERRSWSDIIIGPAFKVFALGVPALALVALAFIWTPVESPAPRPLVLDKGNDLAENSSIPTNEIIAGVLENWPPQYSTDPKTGEPTGFAIDIFNEVAKRANIKVRYKVYKSWSEILKAFLNNEVIIIPNSGIASERGP